jgi:hypothetical protein
MLLMVLSVGWLLELTFFSIKSVLWSFPGKVAAFLIFDTPQKNHKNAPEKPRRENPAP